MKVDVIDPTLANGCVTPTAQGINWIPIKPTTDAAFLLGLIRWIIENKKYNRAFLEYPNINAAWDNGYGSFSNTTHLVIVDETSTNIWKFLTPAEAGIELPEGATTTDHVVIDKETGEPKLQSECVSATLDYEGEVNGIKVKTPWLMLKESAMSRTIAEYAEITGIPASDIERIAQEFTSHGVKAACRMFSGSTNPCGTDAAKGVAVMNALIGCNQMVGGHMPYRIGGKGLADGPRYKLSTVIGKPSVSTKNATYISRTAKAWQATDEYKARIAAGEKNPQPKLPWFPVGISSDNQALVSIANQYPYQAKILFSWETNTLEASPGAMRDEFIEKLKDTSVVPLHVACDVVMGEHAQLADYVVPDTNPYESFGVVTQEGYYHGKGSTVRWRVTEPGTMKLADGRFACWEAFLVDVAKVCGVPGYGDDAITDMEGKSYAFADAPDFFLKAVANLAYDGTPVPDITEKEAHLQGLDELPASWKAAVKPEEWPKVLNVLSRGGRFWPVKDAFGADGRSGYAVKDYQTLVYTEVRGTMKNSFTGAYHSGIMEYHPQPFADLTPLSKVYPETEYPFISNNYKPRFRSVSMLANSPIMMDLCDHNYIEMNADDAKALGISDGDNVVVTAPTGEVMNGEAMVRGGQAKGSFGVAFGYGHRAYGAQDVTIDGETRAGNKAIGAGVHLATMQDAQVSKNGTQYFLADPDCAVPGRNGGMYKIEKA